MCAHPDHAPATTPPPRNGSRLLESVRNLSTSPSPSPPPTAVDLERESADMEGSRDGDEVTGLDIDSSMRNPLPQSVSCHVYGVLTPDETEFEGRRRFSRSRHPWHARRTIAEAVPKLRCRFRKGASKVDVADQRCKTSCKSCRTRITRTDCSSGFSQSSIMSDTQSMSTSSGNVRTPADHTDDSVRRIIRIAG